MTTYGAVSDDDLALAATAIASSLKQRDPALTHAAPIKRRGKAWDPLPITPSPHPWRDLIHSYNWDGDDHAALEIRIAPYLRASSTLSSTLSERAWNTAEASEALTLSQDIFLWGGIRNADVSSDAHAATVFKSALRLASGDHSHISDGPMSSGWTKVAAFATRHLDNPSDFGATPQVIWDSRVANGGMRLTEAAAPDLEPRVASWLKSHLRQVRGRGGSRMNMALPPGWDWAHTVRQKWVAQSAGSRVVRHVRDALNRDPGRFGLMPLPGGTEGPWTSWGVGLALFVEGY
jgi:hypothetical protein